MKLSYLVQQTICGSFQLLDFISGTFLLSDWSFTSASVSMAATEKMKNLKLSTLTTSDEAVLPGVADDLWLSDQLVWITPQPINLPLL